MQSWTIQQQHLHSTCCRTCSISQRLWICQSIALKLFWGRGTLLLHPRRERSSSEHSGTHWGALTDGSAQHTTEGAQLVSRMPVWNWLVSQLNQFWFLPVKWTGLLRQNQRRINMEHPQEIPIHNIPLPFCACLIKEASMKSFQKHRAQKQWGDCSLEGSGMQLAYEHQNVSAISISCVLSGSFEIRLIFLLQFCSNSFPSTEVQDSDNQQQETRSREQSQAAQAHTGSYTGVTGHHCSVTKDKCTLSWVQIQNDPPPLAFKPAATIHVRTNHWHWAFITAAFWLNGQTMNITQTSGCIAGNTIPVTAMTRTLQQPQLYGICYSSCI